MHNNSQKIIPKSISVAQSKINPCWFQNDATLYFEPYWKQENVADINFWYFIKLKN